MRILLFGIPVRELACVVKSLVPPPTAGRPKAKLAVQAARARDDVGSGPGTPLPRGKAEGLAGLEPLPPIKVQRLDPLKSFHSRLIDPRVADLLLRCAKEVEGYLDAKRKLGKSRGQDPLRTPADGQPPTGEGQGGKKGREGKPEKLSRAGLSGGQGQ